MKSFRSRAIVGVLLIVGLMSLVIFFWKPRSILTSSDGRVRFVRVSYHHGRAFSLALGSSAEAWIRDQLFDFGFRKVQRTSLKMSSPPNSHVFILEYRGDTGTVKPNLIRAELIGTNRTYSLIAIGGGSYGFQKRQFSYWVLNGVERLDPQEFRLRVYLPEDAPSLLPVAQ